MSGSSDHGASEASGGEEAHAEVEEEPPHFKVVQLTAVLHGHLKKPWLPDALNVKGETYVRVSRHCPVLTRLCAGKSLNRHKNKARAQVSLQQIFFGEICKLRRDACHARYRAMILESLGPNEERPKIRAAKDSDKYTCSRTVSVEAPSCGDMPGRSLKLLWGVTGVSEFWMQLSSENLEFVVESIKASPVQEKSKRPKAKSSPKRKRRLKRRRSDEVSLQEQLSPAPDQGGSL